MAREFRIYTSSYFTGKGPTGRAVGMIHVSDAANEKEAGDGWPDAARFPISDRYDEETQRKRAYKFADYLNSLVTVMNDLEQDQAI